MPAYFVSPLGSDSADGLSQGTAWLTVSKVNSSSFSAGDTISFLRSGVWNEVLAMPSSGSSGNPIRVQAYGAKTARPMLRGGTRGVSVEGRSWLEFLNLQARNSSDDAGMFVNGASANIVFEDCDASFGQKQGFLVIGDSVTLRRCSGRLNGQIGSDPTLYHGAYIGAFGGAEAASYIVEDCVFSQNPGAGIQSYLAGSGILRRNYCHTNGTWGVIVSNPIASSSIDVDNLLAHGNVYGLEVEGIDAGQLVRVRHATLAGNSNTQLFLQSSTGTNVVQLRNSIVDGTGATLAAQWNGAEFDPANSILYKASGNMVVAGGTPYTMAALYTALGGNPVPTINLLGADPLLKSNYQFGVASPARNKGPDLSISTDRLGVPRPQKGSVDWGCHELRTYVLKAA